jgi:hypothetical protein
MIDPILSQGHELGDLDGWIRRRLRLPWPQALRKQRCEDADLAAIHNR